LIAASTIDSHVHVIDLERFPYPDGLGFKPADKGRCTVGALTETLDQHGVWGSVIVQPSGYGFDNAALIDAVNSNRERYKGIAVVDTSISDVNLSKLVDAGITGARFNLVSFDRSLLLRGAAVQLLERLKELNWIIEVYAPDDIWNVIAPTLLRSGATVLVDHFGVKNLSAGVTQPGFQAVLALGRAGNAFVKLSAPFRNSQLQDLSDLDPYVAELMHAYSIDRCLWGSDWPFAGTSRKITYHDMLVAAAKWVTSTNELQHLLWTNAHKLFRFGDESV